MKRYIDNGPLPQHARRAFTALVAIDAPVYNHGPDNGTEHFILGAELRDGDDKYFADYYQNELREYIDESGRIHNAFGIHDAVHAILDKYGLYAEWINPGQMGIYDAY
jgi:hypothetical protein|tara:strand:- start:5270 stop:5593 length:324 start_codon:yes stop_codon:yes gene_type:complete